ncbi:hypothetical protein EVAR_9565_1 [Eumeta japonica]|uniref:Uncharacterized protein n=1 Tax=Eumeta variegata TaxID=151549 RepID=A0A4C1U3W1_EUMVA|nr:hypothetical protein EVAR_9565_1 [Eumeta japonica]
MRKVVSEKKKAWLDLLSAKANHREQRKDILKAMVEKARNNSETSCIRVIRDDDGHLPNEEQNVKERWKYYFESVFVCEDTVADNNVTAPEYMIDDENDS